MHFFHFFRLQSHISPDENGKVELYHLSNLLPEHSSHEVGRTVRKLFKNIIVKSGRSTDNYKKHTKIYPGIQLKCVCDKVQQTQHAFNDICNFVIDPFFIMSKLTATVKIGFLNGYSINSTKVMSEIYLHNTGTFEVFIANTEINLKHLKINNKYNIDEESIKSVLNSVRSIILCGGANVHDVPEEKLRKGLKEQWRDKHGSECTVLRSSKCLRVIQFLSASQTCLECRRLSHKPSPSGNTFIDTAVTENEMENGNDILLTNCDHSDMATVFNKVLKSEVPEKMMEFFVSQAESLKVNPKGRRWNKDIIRMCLTLYCRSPRGYEDLYRSGFVVLPSQRLIQRYKNKVQHEAGINKDILNWMKNGAIMNDLSKDGYEGGLMIDEMSIQEDLTYNFEEKVMSTNLLDSLNVLKNHSI